MSILAPRDDKIMKNPIETFPNLFEKLFVDDQLIVYNETITNDLAVNNEFVLTNLQSQTTETDILYIDGSGVVVKGAVPVVPVATQKYLTTGTNVGQVPQFYNNAGSLLTTPFPTSFYCYAKYPTTLQSENFTVSYTNGARLAIDTTGIYSISWTLVSSISMSGFMAISKNLGNDNELTVFQNGTNFLAGDIATGKQYCTLSTTAKLDAGDYINLLFYSTSVSSFTPVDYNNRFFISLVQ